MSAVFLPAGPMLIHAPRMMSVVHCVVIMSLENAGITRRIAVDRAEAADVAVLGLPVKAVRIAMQAVTPAVLEPEMDVSGLIAGGMAPVPGVMPRPS
jgi:hypothetical protein